MTQNYWLMKTEPETYSFAQLVKDRGTSWNGVRNFQARNNLRLIAKGDLALIYHSGDERAVVGVAKVTKSAYPDPDPRKKGDWVQVDLTPVKALQRPIALSELKSHPALVTLPLIRHTRLSVMPVTADHYNLILKLGSPQ